MKILELQNKSMKEEMSSLKIDLNKHGLMWTQPERTGMNWNELESWKRLKWI